METHRTVWVACQGRAVVLSTRGKLHCRCQKILYILDLSKILNQLEMYSLKKVRDLNKKVCNCLISEYISEYLVCTQQMYSC